MRRNNAPRGGHGGPLMTEHLQLQDLDLELELLKRKREMIEQQQQMLTKKKAFNRPSPFEFGNQPHQLFQGQHQPFNSDSGFSAYYNEPGQFGIGGGSSGLLGKRPPVWASQSNVTAKRFSGPQGGSKKKFGGNNSGSFSHFNQQPSRQPWDTKPKNFGASKPNFPSQRFNNSPKGGKPPQRDFRPTKVTKPKPAQGKAAVPTPAVKMAAKDENLSGSELVLRADVVPSQQMAGRLELALGQIVKEIKTKYGAAEHVTFQSQVLARKMKQAIRERLRSVMLGKAVGKVDSIVGHYRRAFPPGTDVEIIQIALDEQNNVPPKKLAIELDSAGSAFMYMKTNMNKLIGVTLDDVFSKLQGLYEELDAEETKEICNQIIKEAADLTKDVSATEKDKKDSTEGTENANKGENGEAVENTVEKDKEETSNTTDDAQTTVDSTPAAVKTEETPAESDKPAENSDKPAEDKDKKTEATGQRKPDWKKIDDLIGVLLKHKLTMILPKYKPLMLKLLNANSLYRVTKTAIFEKTQERLNIENRVEQAASLNSTIDLSATEKEADVSDYSKKLGSKFAYLVKITGQPTLPTRKMMRSFLDEFNPSSVKKHRKIDLLFVAFDNKEGFDKIVAVKETVVGNSKLIITANERNNKNESLNSSESEKVISSDLDEQITDLLSSIRKEEEGIDSNDPGTDSVVEPQSEALDEGESEAAVNGTDANGDEKKTEDAEMAEGEEVAEDEVEEVTEDAEVAEVIDDEDAEVVEVKPGETEQVEKEEAKDKVEALKAEVKETGRATPTRTSSRLANSTPSSIRTRRASKLAPN
ncbi:uncharacterized protein LOC114357129 [Ostrinia furnacalis]|uniref:uncharacterized protein LOC114357129 n=1 Tax=Ostrinia furnacalis TaxID=93504 RepID=UPI00103DC4BC|nr:uncharacterized protein LOC114357129 [Ostrinia furnacalis]